LPDFIIENKIVEIKPFKLQNSPKVLAKKRAAEKAAQLVPNWKAGSFFGNILGFETTIAFTLETASLGIAVFGWKRVSRTVHFLAQLVVLAGASLSAFWIMVANSWMQMPRGIHMDAGRIIVDDYAAAIFNPDSLVSFVHMWFACIESTLVLMMGLAAWALLRKPSTISAPASASAPGTIASEMVLDRHVAGDFFLRTFTYALAMLVGISLAQVVVGHVSGDIIARYQPEKLAASELHWETNAPGTGASWNVIAWPNMAGTGNSFTVAIPAGLSLITQYSPTATVPGLNSFPADDRPTAAESTLTFYAFRLMVLCGFLMAGLALWGLWYWRQGVLTLEGVATHRVFWRAWVWAMPLGFVATEMGWMTREIGRQPWVMYHIMRVSDAVSSNLDPTIVSLTIAAITLLYLALGALFIYFVRRILVQGPDLASPLPRSTI
jgi:cytochrome d ubiquinol oxidase subunit I